MDQEASSTVEGVRVPGFSVVRRIGIGGFATVYEAVQEDVGAPVALKVLALDHAEERVRVRFERECRTMGSLRGQRGIVPVYQAAYSADGRPVIVMELMPGGTLLDRMQAQGPLPVDEVVDIGITIARALQAAHDKGVHHRDVKPENILLDAEGNPGLSDFGIATIGDLSNSTRTVASLSPPHASPERFRGGATIEPTSGDVYSLASSLYHLLAGHPPFGTAEDGGLVALLDRVLNTDAPAIDRAEVPEKLMIVLRTALEKDPAARQSSASEFATQLERVRANLTGADSRAPTTASNVPRPPSPTTPTIRSSEPTTSLAPTNTVSPRLPDDSDRPPSNPTTIITNSDATRMIPPLTDQESTGTDDRRESTTADPLGADPSVPRRRMRMLVVGGSVVGVLLLAIGIAVARGTGTSSAGRYTPLSAENTAGGLHLVWTTGNGTPPPLTAVAYCTAAPSGSDPCASQSIQRLSDQNPSKWSIGQQPGTVASRAIAGGTQGAWTNGTRYCFAVIDDSETAARNDRLSEWACVTTS